MERLWFVEVIDGGDVVCGRWLFDDELIWWMFREGEMLFDGELLKWLEKLKDKIVVREELKVDWFDYCVRDLVKLEMIREW